MVLYRESYSYKKMALFAVVYRPKSCPGQSLHVLNEFSSAIKAKKNGSTIKLFFLPHWTVGLNKLESLASFQPSLTFVSKAGAWPSGAPLCVVFFASL
jgi:hypothetical protein